MQQLAARDVVCPSGRPLNALGETGSDHLKPFWNLMKARRRIHRGQTVVGGTDPVKHLTVLLGGVACSSTQREDGTRQISGFHYPGDFLGLHSFLFPRSAQLSEVQALTSCTIGTIDCAVLDQEIARRPELGRALWQAAMTEASTYRQRLLLTRQPALQRVAHLLCEQLSRLGGNERVIPLNQIDVADAVGLSVVHTNRIFQELRELGVLSQRRC